MFTSTHHTARAATVALLTIVATSNVEAQIRPIVRDSARPGVDINRPPVTKIPGQPGGAMLPSMPKPAAPAPAPVAETAVAGYEIVVGSNVEVAPLTTATTSAQCPSNKVALSAGVEFLGPAESMYGFEVLGARPEGRLGTVRARNANVLVRGTVRAYAVCIAAMPGVRQVDRQLYNNRAQSRFSCAPHERIAGGGVMGRDDTVIQASAPEYSSEALSHWYSTFASNTIGMTEVNERAICAPATQLSGWQIAKGAPLQLGMRGAGTVSVMCPGGTVPIAFGVVGDFSKNMVWSTLVPQLSGSVSARVQNRSIIATDPKVSVQLQAACVRRA